METYVALLRGINVSGQKIIRMDDLKKTFKSQNYENVRTYIQSGNIIFQTKKTDINALKKKIENQIRKSFSFEVTVLLRSHSDIAEIIKQNPFGKNSNSDDGKLYLSFLSEAPDEASKKELLSIRNDLDELKISKTEVYILCRGGYGKSQFSNTFIEKKLKVQSTTRNWATVNKLLEIANS